MNNKQFSRFGRNNKITDRSKSWLLETIADLLRKYFNKKKTLLFKSKTIYNYQEDFAYRPFSKISETSSSFSLINVLRLEFYLKIKIVRREIIKTG